MIPVGQLDGGHIAYTMFGEKNHYKIAVVSFIVLMILGLLGLAESIFELSTTFGWVGWLLWALLLFFIIKLKHPVVPDYSELDGKRKFLGYISFLILIISFSPTPFMVSLGK
jgi:membrane-associated protease RseP (regulator of RpoE activity)